MADEDDEGGFGGLYEDGHWAWDDATRSLVFVSDLPPKQIEAIQISTKAPTGAVEFRDDIDLIEQDGFYGCKFFEIDRLRSQPIAKLINREVDRSYLGRLFAKLTEQEQTRDRCCPALQLRFRRRYQRKVKSGQAEVITVQDVKDIALYTAPTQILSPTLINMLHLPTTERFIRALILYMAYYLQTADEMAHRMLELDAQVRTPDCEIIENVYRDNLEDLRLLVAKEYSIMLIGGSDTKKYHHMGPAKKRRSLSDKDARLFETLLRMCVQIVWLALGRKSFNQIEVEINRIFKSEIFNVVEHVLKTNYISKMSKEERMVLLGHCLRRDKKLHTRSPLMNEVFCHRDFDYRMVGLGVLKPYQISPRLFYMLQAVAGPEEKLQENGIVLGILGLSRSTFDTMLRPLPTAGETGKSKASMSSTSGYSSSKSTGSMRKSVMVAQKMYPDIVLPVKDAKETFLPSSFPDEPEQIRPCSEVQRRRWQTRLMKLLHP